MAPSGCYNSEGVDFLFARILHQEVHAGSDDVECSDACVILCRWMIVEKGE